LLLALLFAYLFDPVVTRLTRISWMSRSLASVCIIIGLAVLVVLPAIIGLGFGILQGIELVGSLGDKAVLLQTALTSFGEEQGRAVAQLDGAWKSIYLQLQNTEDSGFFNTLVTDLTAWVSDNRAAVGKQAVSTITGAAGLLITAISSVGAFAFFVFLTAFFFFFISTSYRDVIDFLGKLVPQKNRERTIDLVQKFDRVVAAFIRGRLTIAAIQSVFFCVGYLIAGVPAAILLGILTGVLSIVPYLALQMRGAQEACLIVIDGLPGLGKTTTLKNWVAQTGSVYLRAKKEWTPNWFMNWRSRPRRKSFTNIPRKASPARKWTMRSRSAMR